MGLNIRRKDFVKETEKVDRALPPVQESLQQQFVMDENEAATDDIIFCKECQTKFDNQQGELRILDMCSDCKEKTLMSIYKDLMIYGDDIYKD